MLKRPFGLMALACAGLLGAGAVAVASQDLRPGTAEAASEPTDVLKPPPGVPQTFEHRLDPEEMAEHREDFYSDLADELGTTAEEVKDAFRAVFEKRIEEDVDEGRLTRDQADQILKAGEPGIPPGPMVHMRLRGQAPGQGAPPPPPPLP